MLLPSVLLAALVGAPAHAEPGAHTIALSATGGYDYQTSQPAAGVALDVRHDGTRGFAFVGRFEAQAGLYDDRPLFRLEGGFAGVVPSKGKAITRLGLVGGSAVYVAPFPLPLQVGGNPTDPEAFGNPGFLPYGAAIVELGWTRPDKPKGPAAWAVGARAGAALSATTVPCGDAEAPGCRLDQVTFDGGVYGRMRFHEGAFLELIIGPSPRLTVGYAFGRPSRGPSTDEAAAQVEPAAEEVETAATP